jgi:hypothetical protein
MSARPVIIMAGGTGGHVFPALALARLLRESSCEVVWLGTRRGLEARIIPAERIAIEWLSIGGLRGKGAFTWLAAPFRLALALAQALAVMRRHRPRRWWGWADSSPVPAELPRGSRAGRSSSMSRMPSPVSPTAALRTWRAKFSRPFRAASAPTSRRMRSAIRCAPTFPPWRRRRRALPREAARSACWCWAAARARRA